MNELIKFTQAQIIGRSHLLSGRNSQDAGVSGKIEIGGNTVYYGVVCDGCSEGKNSEVGAKLAASFIARQIEILVKSKVDIKRIPWILHKRTVEFMRQLLGKISFDTPASRVNYIKDNLLFTVMGFIYTPKGVVIFSQGDGVIVINDEVTVIDQDDAPKYIGYALVERKYLAVEASVLPQSFETIEIPAESITKLAIASDSLGHEQELIPEIWESVRPVPLQKKVNVWSLVEHRFRDDLTIITLEKIQGG